MVLSPAIQRAAHAVIDTLMAEVKGIKAVVVATEDGFEVAAKIENTAQVSRLAAMASSLAALGAVAGEESGLGLCDSVLIEAAHGYILMLQSRHPDIGLIISVITSREAVMGQALYLSRQAAKILEKA